jgi:glycerol-3-phosphate acyltransferase PlsY
VILDLLLGYLIGSSLGGTLFKYISRTDLAQVGSRNIGARNAHRAGGFPAFLCVYLFDAAKTVFAMQITDTFYPVALAVLIGHMFPLFHPRRGGKGYAVFSGIVFAITPWAYLAGLGILGLSYLVTKDSVKAGLIPVVLLPLLPIFLDAGSVNILCTVAVSQLVLRAHDALQKPAIR